jgi:hypothetical protein
MLLMVFPRKLENLCRELPLVQTLSYKHPAQRAFVVHFSTEKNISLPLHQSVNDYP